MNRKVQLIKRCLSSYPSPKPKDSIRKKTTLFTINKLYENKEPITVMTAHDYPSGCYVDNAGIDMCLVGDSLAMVALGYQSTNEITLEEMIHHSKAVSRGCTNAFLVGDMPFGTYERGSEFAIQNAIDYIRKGRVEAVKLEGGIEMAETIKKISSIGIPILGHIGLTPQRQTSLGGFRVQGKTLAKAKKLYEDAIALQEAGCFAIVLEAIPEAVANLITKKLNIPTIGIGAGKGCDGQVLVQLDALRGHNNHIPKFCHGFEEISQKSIDALKQYAVAVKSREFPVSNVHTYQMQTGEQEKLLEWISEMQKVN